MRSLTKRLALFSYTALFDGLRGALRGAALGIIEALLPTSRLFRAPQAADVTASGVRKGKRGWWIEAVVLLN